MARRGNRPSIEGHLPSHNEPDWLALVVSGLSHVVVILLVVALVRFREPPPPSAQQPRRAAPDTTIIFLPPPAPKPPPPVVQQQPPPPPPVARARQPEKEDDPNAQPEERRREGREDLSSAPPADESVGDPEASSTPPIEEPTALAVTMESEAQRIFGRKRGTPTKDAGPVAVRPFENAREPDNDCPVIPRDSVTGEVPAGTVQGRVVDYDNGVPLRGAHLQMVGQPFNTFADDNGNFVLKFDLTLMENCRVQLVRISSLGHRDQTLPIVMGGGVSTVPLRKK